MPFFIRTGKRLPVTQTELRLVFRRPPQLGFWRATMRPQPDQRARDADPRHNYHQFQPLLYQVPTSQLAPSDVAFQMRKLFREHPNVDVKLAEVATVDPVARTVTAADGGSWTGDAVVLAAGSVPNFFRTPGADRHAFPLYSLDDATRLRSRIIGVFEDADRDPSLLDRGALNFVVVGGGPDRRRARRRARGHDPRHHDRRVPRLAVSAARIHLVDLGHVLLAPFSEKAHDYVAKVLQRKGVELHLGVRRAAPRCPRGGVGAGHAGLSDGTTIPSRCVVWAAASRQLRPDCPRAPAGASTCCPTSRSTARPACTPSATWPAGRAPASSARLRGSAERRLGGGQPAGGLRRHTEEAVPLPRHGHHGDDRSRRRDRRSRAASHGHELHGAVAHAAWLGVHAALMTGVRNRVEGFLDWGWDAFSRTRGPQVLDRSDAARIDWDEDRVPEPVAAGRS